VGVGVVLQQLVGQVVELLARGETGSKISVIIIITITITIIITRACSTASHPKGLLELEPDCRTPHLQLESGGAPCILPTANDPQRWYAHTRSLAKASSAACRPYLQLESGGAGGTSQGRGRGRPLVPQPLQHLVHVLHQL
jgi:hypothetical protein